MDPTKQQVQGQRRAQEEYHTNYVHSLQLAEQQSQVSVAPPPALIIYPSTIHVLYVDFALLILLFVPSHICTGNRSSSTATCG